MINTNMSSMFVLNGQANVCRGVFTFVFKAIRLGTYRINNILNKKLKTIEQNRFLFYYSTEHPKASDNIAVYYMLLSSKL